MTSATPPAPGPTRVTRGLFTRIFAWYWIASIAVVGVAVASAALLISRSSIEMARWRVVAHDAAVIHSERAADVLERGGADAVCDFLLRWDVALAAHSYIIDADGKDLCGDTPPAAAAAFVEHIRESGRAEIVQRSGEPTLIGAKLPTRDGKPLVLLRTVAEGQTPPLRPPPRGGPRGGPGGPPGGPRPPRGGPRDGPPGGPLDPPPLGLRPDLPPGIGGPPVIPPLGDVLVQPSVGAVVLLAVAASGAVCYLLARSLSRPVRELQAAVRQLAGGDLSVRVAADIGRRSDEIGALARDFDQMAARLQREMDAQGRLLRDMSHELRSPLARLNVALGIARKQGTGAAAHALDRIERESDALNRLIGDVLTLARWDNGAMNVQTSDIDLAELLRAIVEDADFEARSVGKQVTLTIDSPCSVQADPGLLHSAIENIVRNAVRYTAENSAVEVTLATDPASGSAVIRVRDRGPGVPAQAVAELFRPFYRVSEGRDRDSGGVGLGLAITQRIVQSHGGSVSAENAAGGGLAVEVRIPTGAFAEPRP
ncbi:Sensor protein CpxA [Phycisphaerae bacterium RAS1]|nr:Sensor protein CpxA [Phycisphaerae bacterium RAS1]